MPATVAELFTGRTETTGGSALAPRTVSAEVPYVVFDAADEVEATTAALATVPFLYAGLRRVALSLDQRLNATTWRFTARYEETVPTETGTSVFTFDTGGGNQHITQSLSTVGRYGPAASTVLGGAIGYDGEQVAGVDITVPVYAFSETHYLADSVVTLPYRGALFRLTGKTNSAAFRGLAAGECLFLGASGSQRGEGDWEITFKFAGSPNKTGLMVGGIGPITKNGWDYLWVQYGDEVDPAVSRLVKKPIAAYVERVYEAGDFADLGIGA